MGSISRTLSAGYNAIGVQFCTSYTLAGFSFIVLYHRQPFESFKNSIFMGLWLLLGAVFMTVIFLYLIPPVNGTTKDVGLGSMAVGLIPMACYWMKGSDYLKMPSREDGTQL